MGNQVKKIADDFYNPFFIRRMRRTAEDGKFYILFYDSENSETRVKYNSLRARNEYYNQYASMIIERYKGGLE